MKICHCTLGGTRACVGCSNNSDYTFDSEPNIVDDFYKWLKMQPHTTTSTSTAINGLYGTTQ